MFKRRKKSLLFFLFLIKIRITQEVKAVNRILQELQLDKPNCVVIIRKSFKNFDRNWISDRKRWKKWQEDCKSSVPYVFSIINSFIKRLKTPQPLWFHSICLESFCFLSNKKEEKHITLLGDRKVVGVMIYFLMQFLTSFFSFSTSEWITQGS